MRKPRLTKFSFGFVLITDCALQTQQVIMLVYSTVQEHAALKLLRFNGGSHTEHGHSHTLGSANASFRPL